MSPSDFAAANLQRQRVRSSAPFSGRVRAVARALLILQELVARQLFKVPGKIILEQIGGEIVDQSDRSSFLLHGCGRPLGQGSLQEGVGLDPAPHHTRRRVSRGGRRSTRRHCDRNSNFPFEDHGKRRGAVWGIRRGWPDRYPGSHSEKLLRRRRWRLPGRRGIGRPDRLRPVQRPARFACGQREK